jgi:hypothetical protein
MAMQVYKITETTGEVEYYCAQGRGGVCGARCRLGGQGPNGGAADRG